MAYRRTTAVARRLADNRDRILAAARTLIGKGGFRAATITAVANEAGIATGTVYRYFPSKADLFAEVMRDAARRELQVLTETAAADGPPLARLDAVVAAFVTRAIRGQRLAHAMIAEPVDPVVEAERLVLREGYATILGGLMKAAIAAGDMPARDVRIAADCIVGAMIEPLIGPLAAGTARNKPAADKLLGEIRRFVLAALGASVANASNPNVIDFKTGDT